MESPFRRVLAVDAGSRCVRLLMVESRLGRLRVLRQDALDLKEEGLVSADELKAHLQSAIQEWGRPAVALALPQQITVSQIVDLPPVPDSEARQLIGEEIRKLGGVSESAIVYDFARVGAPRENRQRFWVSFSQEGEIQNRINQLGLDGEEFREITTTANALLTAWHAARPRKRDVVLVHVGAQGTTVVVVRDGDGVFATTFSMGGDFFTRAVARLRGCPPEQAETLKRQTNLIEGKLAVAGLAEVVDGWAAELKRQLHEWREHHPSLGNALTESELIASGGVFEQPGLLDYLRTRAGLKFSRWPTDGAPEALLPALGFEIALGTALQALGHSPQPASLVPANRRAAWKRRLGRQRLESVNAILLAACALALAFGVWQKLMLLQRKQSLLAKVEAGLETAQADAALTREVLTGYETIRPLFERQQATADTLRTLAQLQAARSNRTWWVVVLADQQSYFSHLPAQTTTNKPPVSPGTAEAESSIRRAATNAPPVKPGLIAELSVPEDADSARRTLGLLVNDLKKSPVFARVDLLSEDLRRSIADPKVLLADRHFALALDFATTEFQPSSAGKRQGPVARSVARPGLTAKPAPERPGDRPPGS